MKRSLLSIDDLSRADIERILDRAESFAEVSGPRDQEGADAARAHRGQPLLRGLDAHELLVRARGQAPLGRPGDPEVGGLVGGEGGVPEGHRADAVGLPPGGDRDPLAARRGGRPGRSLEPGRGGQRRRRQARAPDPGAPRPVHAAPPGRAPRRQARVDRGRRAALAGGALQHPRLRAHGLRGDRVRPAHADPARRRVARLRGRLRPGPAAARPTWSTRCGCSRSG